MVGIIPTDLGVVNTIPTAAQSASFVSSRSTSPMRCPGNRSMRRSYRLTGLDESPSRGPGEIAGSPSILGCRDGPSVAALAGPRGRPARYSYRSDSQVPETIFRVMGAVLVQVALFGGGCASLPAGPATVALATPCDD